jgi:hypothetical protein
VGTRRRPYWEKRSKDREKLDLWTGGERRERGRRSSVRERAIYLQSGANPIGLAPTRREVNIVFSSI